MLTDPWIQTRENRNSEDWTSPPSNRTEWEHRLNATLIMCRKPMAAGENYPVDLGALYASGATYAQAAVACCNAKRYASDDAAPNYIR